MDDTTSKDDICIRGRLAPEDRLFESAFAMVVLVFGIIIFALGDYVFAVMILLFGGWLLYRSFRKGDVVWIVKDGNVLIEEPRPWSRPSTRMILRHDISHAHVREGENGSGGFRLALLLASGNLLISPPIEDATSSGECSDRIARQFGLRDAEFALHASDAADTEIRLGKPVSTAIGRANRMIALILAGLFSLPYAYKIWHSEPLAAGEILFIPIGLIFVIVRFVYACRLCGTRWIIKQGEIRIEWLSLNGQLCADTIKGSDIKSVSIGPPSGGWDSENRQCALHIRSHAGQELRSPEIGDESAGLAKLAEITRILRLEPQTNRS